MTSRENRDLKLRLQRAEEELDQIQQETGIARFPETLKEGKEPLEIRLTAESTAALEQAQHRVDEIKRQIEKVKGPL